MSSPRFPESNGKAEAAMKSMKNLISAAWVRRGVDEAVLARALLQHRNTPSRRDGLSPAQKLFGRPVQDVLPAHRRVLAPEWQHSADDAEEQVRFLFATGVTCNTVFCHRLPALPTLEYSQPFARTTSTFCS